MKYIDNTYLLESPIISIYQNLLNISIYRSVYLFLYHHFYD